MSKTSAVPRESHQYILFLQQPKFSVTNWYIFRENTQFSSTLCCVWFYGQKHLQKHVSHTNIFERGEYICPQSYAVRKHDKLIGENTKVGNKIISYNYYKSVCVPHTCKTVKVNILHISVSFVWHFSFVVIGFNLNKS